MPFTFKISVRLALMKASLALAAAAAAAVAACELSDQAGPPPPPQPDNVVVQVVTSPESVTLDPYQTEQFLAYGRTASGDSIAVSVAWRTSGGGGTITAGGLYRADTIPGDYQVTATVSGSTTTGSSQVRNRGPLAAVVVTPAAASTSVGGTLQFTAYGKKKNGDSVAVSVVWSATGGSISTAGLYTAPQSAGTYRVIATQSGGTLADTAAVTVASAPVALPGTVSDLRVAGMTDSSVTLSFTEVTDGTGQAASYDVRWAAGAISWGTAASVSRGTCSTPLAGSVIGAKRTCTVLGLAAGTGYQFQLVAFRGTLGSAVFGSLSNVASGTTTASGGGTVLLREDFEDTGFGARGWYDFSSTPTLTTATHATGSTQALEVHFAAGATTPPWRAARRLFTPSPTLYVSYWVRYSDNWIGSRQLYHPHEFQIMSDLDGAWDGLSNSWMEAYIEHNYQNGGIPRLSIQDSKAINTSYGAPPINLISVTENRSIAGCNGVVERNVVTSCFSFPPWYNDKEITAPQVWFQPSPGPGYKGNWNHVEAYFQINSIVNGIGQADGVAQYWFNGALVIDRHDILFRTGARPSINFKQFVIAPYIGDGSPVDQTMWVDNLLVATARP
jgi:hypothetical protein